MKKEVQNYFNKWFVMLVICFLSTITFGQTQLINPNLEGGFEVGPTFAANGWTVSNSANNPWVVGTAVNAAPIGGNSAYISNNGGTTNAYTNTAACVNYFYRDVTVPAGESKKYALAKARELWTNETFYASPRCKTPHDGIVDAALIARYARKIQL
jgi:hypothetical protein